jgi:predicted DNA-binding transcriptional regulator AlpA
MALILKKESAFQRWYKKNKQDLSEKRKKQYADDPEYRKRALEASRKRRRGESTLTTPPDALICFAEAAERIGISISALYEWRRKKFFPEPKHYDGALWFTDTQVLLLKDLKDRVYGKRRRYMKLDRFEEVIAYMFANWE